MLCAISGEAPQQPVASRKSGNVFEKRLIEAYIAENDTDPVNGEELTTDDLIELKQSRAVKPRPPTLTSIPALLSTFQNEWDAIILETFQLKQQLAATRQELSTALYYNDSAQRVIARLQKERDDARDALSRVTVSSTNGINGTHGDAMQVDQSGLSESALARIGETQQRLSSTRRKRPVPAEWASGEDISAYEVKERISSDFTGANSLAVDGTGNHFLCTHSDGGLGVYDLKDGSIVTKSNLGAGVLLDGTFVGDKTAIATASGAVVLTSNGSAEAKWQQHAGVVTAVAAHPCGDILASVGVDKSYVLYDLQSSSVLVQTYTDSELTTVTFHPDGHLLALGTTDGSIKLYDVKTSQIAHMFPAAAEGPISALSFSENGTWLASAHEGQSSVIIWDLRKLSQLTSLEMGTAVTGIAWDYTGQFLAACGPGAVVVSQYDKKAKSWSEPLRKAVNAVDVRWGVNAQSLIALMGEGGVAMLRA